MDESFIVRRPILDGKGGLVGYELDFRHVADDEYDSATNAHKSYAKLLAETFSNFEMDVLLGKGLGFLRLGVDSLFSETLGDLPKERFVFEVPWVANPDSEMFQRCKEMKRQGIQMALADYVRNDPRAILLDYVNFIKVDVSSTSESGLRALLRLSRRTELPLIADGVETPKLQQWLENMGFDHFQGFYFARLPERWIDPSELDPDRSILLDLLQRLDSGIGIEELEEIFKQNAKLGVNLLRLVNGLHFSRGMRVESVNQALMTVGINGLLRWLSIMLFAGGERTGPESPLLSIAAVRSRMLELLQSELDAPGEFSAEESKLRCDRAFFTGLLSLYPVLLGMSTRDVLATLPVDETIEVALLERDNSLGKLLCMIEKVEVGEFEELDKELASMGLTRAQLQQAQLKAFQWVGHL